MNTFLLYLIFLVPAVGEGIGVRIDHRFFLFWYLAIPTVLYFFFLKKKERFHLPIKMTLIFLLFLNFSAVSTFFFSLDKQVSFENFLFYCSLFLICIFFYNNKHLGEKFIRISIPLLSIIFIAYSVSIPFLKKIGTPFFIPAFEKQTVMPIFSSHNQLGDFLGLGLIMFFISLIKKNNPILMAALIIFFYFFIFSFSRSAYVSIFIVLVIFLIQSRIKRQPLYFLGLIIVTLSLFSFFIISSSNFSSNSPFFGIQQYIKNTKGLVTRNLISGHSILISQAFKSIKEYPYFGIGNGNFLLASWKYNNANDTSDSSHNLILDIGVEQGIPAALVLLIIIAFLLIQALKKKSVESYLFIYLLLNFQTNYAYQIYLFLILSVIFAGIIYEEDASFEFSPLFFGSATTVLIVSLFAIVSSFLFLKSGYPLLAIHVYPLNKKAYVEVIGSNKNLSFVEKAIHEANSIAPYDLPIIVSSANYYLETSQKRKALRLYEKAYEANHLVNFSISKQIYFLKRQLDSRQEADLFLTDVIKDLKKTYLPEYFREDFNTFCRQAETPICLNVF